MNLATIRGLPLLVIVLAAPSWNTLDAQTRQEQVANERAKSAATGIRACSYLKSEELRKYADKWQAMELDNPPYDMGSTCDWGGFVTLRVFAGAKPTDQLEWTLKNYKMDTEKRTPINGFGAGAFIMFPKPQSQYQDEAALLVGRAGSRMFMVTLIPPNGKTPQSMQPQLESLARTVMARLR